MENDYHIFLKYLVLQMKNLVSQIKNFKIPGFLHIELESEIPVFCGTYV